MKRFFSIVLTALIALNCLLLSGCSAGVLPRPETDLEFWIGENAEDADFSRCAEKHGIMGGREYYGSAYTPAVGGNGLETDPDECVIYTVAPYPDASSEARHVVRITITDPAVSVYGITLNSADAEIAAAMKGNGFRLVSGDTAGGMTFKKGGFTFRFDSGKIVISAATTNKKGIQY